MWNSLILKGSLIGLSIAMPIGPISMLCIRHALVKGMSYGLASGLGAALADAVYGAIAGYSVNAVTNILASYEFWFQIFGAIFLTYLGLSTLLAKPVEPAVRYPATHFKVCLYTFLITLTNPMTLLCFAGIYASCGLNHSCEGFVSPLMLTLGVFIGSTLWWLILSTLISLLGKRLPATSTVFVNKFSGILFLCFAAMALLAAIYGVHYC